MIGKWEGGEADNLGLDSCRELPLAPDLFVFHFSCLGFAFLVWPSQLELRRNFSYSVDHSRLPKKQCGWKSVPC